MQTWRFEVGVSLGGWGAKGASWPKKPRQLLFASLVQLRGIFGEKSVEKTIPNQIRMFYCSLRLKTRLSSFYSLWVFRRVFVL